MESEWPFKGIVVGDAYKELHEGIEGTMETQLRKLCQLLEREIASSEVAKELFERIAHERVEKPLEVFLGKCSCGFVDSFYNMAMDVDDFDHFPITPLKSDDGNLHGLTQGEILLHVFEERLLMNGDREEYEKCHLACFHPESCQNRHRLNLGFKSTVAFMRLLNLPLQICYFDKDGDESSGCLKFYCFDRDGAKTTIEEIQAGKSSYVEQWRNYAPSLRQMKLDRFDYLAFVTENYKGYLELLIEQITTTGAVDRTEAYKAIYWIGENERSRGVQDPKLIEGKQLEDIMPHFLGLYIRKGFDALFARWKIATGYPFIFRPLSDQISPAISAWRDKAKARDLITDTCRKRMEKCPLSIISERSDEITKSSFQSAPEATNSLAVSLHFQQYLTKRKSEILALMKKKCETAGITITQEELDSYLCGVN